MIKMKSWCCLGQLYYYCCSKSLLFHYCSRRNFILALLECSFDRDLQIISFFYRIGHLLEHYKRIEHWLIVQWHIEYAVGKLRISDFVSFYEWLESHWPMVQQLHQISLYFDLPGAHPAGGQQSPSLHASLSVASPSQYAPGQAGFAFWQSRSLCLVPSPQLTLHDPQAFQTAQVPSAISGKDRGWKCEKCTIIL